MKKIRLPLAITLALGIISPFSMADNLQEVYSLALQKDPQVQKAKATLKSNKIGIKTALATLLPQVSVTGTLQEDFSEREVDANTDPNNAPIFVPAEIESITASYNFRLTQEIFNLASWQQLDRSEKVALQSESAYQQAKQALITRVATAYFDILKAQDDLEFARAEKRAIERQLEQTKQRFAVGLTAITDVHEAQAQFDNAVATEIRAENDVEVRKEFLREITGRFHDELAPLNTERFSTTKLTETAGTIVSRAENQNQEIKGQQLGLDIAKQDIDIAFSGHLPTLSLTADKGRRNSNRNIVHVNGELASRSNPGPSDSETIRIDLNVPIYSGGSIDARVRQAQANYVAASEDLELIHRRIVREVRSSYADVVSLISSIRALEQAVVSAESALKATEAGFEVGTRTIVDVLNSTQNLYNAKRNLSKTRYDYILAMLNLKQAAGDISDDDVAQINQGLVGA